MEIAGRPQLLTGKVVIVTGGGHGIGKAYVRRLAESGAKVVIAEIDRQACQTVPLELKKEGLDVIGIPTDVSDKKSLKEMANETLKQFGKIDSLINNAAVFETIPISRVSFDEVPFEEWDRVMNVNVKGTWLACRAVVPQMKKQGGGKIITIASGTAFHGRGGRIHYITTKAAILGFTKALARELGDYNITVNCIAPGGTLSVENVSDEDLSHRKGNIAGRALKRIQTPEDLVGTAEFLCSDNSNFITGQTIVVDGGNYMN